MKNGVEIIGKLKSRFDPGAQVLFEWFAFAKDELFSDSNDYSKYNLEFFDSNEDYDCILKVPNNVELQ